MFVSQPHAPSALYRSPALVLLTLAQIACSSADPVRKQGQEVADYTNDLAWADVPPDSLDPLDAPQFVAITFDDNFKADGMAWATSFFAPLQNPAGAGFLGSYDGTLARTSFYYNSVYIDSSEENRLAWSTAAQDGHETANHTKNHNYGSSASVEEWTAEISACTSELTNAEFGIGVTSDEISGFRAPYLGYNTDLYATLISQTLTYDTSVQNCWAEDQDGTNCSWPYTLNSGSPDADVLTAKFEQPSVGDYPGLWEVPVSALIVPPDSAATAYGFDPGLRLRIPTDMAAPNFYEVDTGKLAPLDITLFVDAAMTAREVLATLKYNLDLHLAGNRSPLVFVAHTHVYDSEYGAAPNAPTAEERRGAIEDFVIYALSLEPVRMRPLADVVSWMRAPEPLGGVRTVIPSPTGGTGGLPEGSGGTGGNDGSGGNASGGSSGSGASGGAPDSSEEKAACSCKAPGSSAPAPSGAALALLCVAAASLRRRRREVR